MTFLWKFKKFKELNNKKKCFFTFLEEKILKIFINIHSLNKNYIIFKNFI